MTAAENAATELPSYRNPPLDEVAIALQFDQIKPFALIYGAFAEEVRQRLPQHEELEPMAVSFETFSDTPLQTPSQFIVDRSAMPRAWFISEDGHRLAQIQPDRFVQNWRRKAGEGTYPRFAAVMEDLCENFRAFEKVVERENGGSLNLNQCEVSYFNVFPVQEGEGYPQAFARLFDWLGCEKPLVLSGSVAEPELVTISRTFIIKNASSDEPRARVHIVAQPAISMLTGTKVFRMSLIFRGPPPAQDWATVEAFLQEGREAIVRLFTDITSASCHKEWGREN